MIAQELEVSLHMAFVEARQKRHEFITVEHLLLALIDNPSAAEALRACGGKPDALRKDLTNFINEHTPVVSGEDDIDTARLFDQIVVDKARLRSAVRRALRRQPQITLRELLDTPEAWEFVSFSDEHDVPSSFHRLPDVA